MQENRATILSSTTATQEENGKRMKVLGGRGKKTRHRHHDDVKCRARTSGCSFPVIIPYTLEKISSFGIIPSFRQFALMMLHLIAHKSGSEWDVVVKVQ